jgi:hypothetical protein
MGALQQRRDGTGLDQGVEAHGLEQLNLLPPWLAFRS